MLKKNEGIWKIVTDADIKADITQEQFESGEVLRLPN